MASSQDFIDFVCEQVQKNFNARYRKMFGDYMVYLNDKPVILVCDNVCYVKELKEIEHLMKNAPRGIPYEGSKEHYILDIEDDELSIKVLKILEELTPIPVKKKKK